VAFSRKEEAAYVLERSAEITDTPMKWNSLALYMITLQIERVYQGVPALRTFKLKYTLTQCKKIKDKTK
jgi:hypothetical protein